MTPADYALASRFAGPAFPMDTHAKAPTYAPEVTTTAREIGVEMLIADLTELADFLASSEDVREPSKEFGPISNKELVGVMFTSSYYRQTLEACRELRNRFIEEKSEYVLREAAKAMEA